MLDPGIEQNPARVVSQNSVGLEGDQVLGQYGLQPTTTSAVELTRVTVLAAGRCSSSVGGQRWSLQLKPRPLDTAGVCAKRVVYLLYLNIRHLLYLANRDVAARYRFGVRQL